MARRRLGLLVFGVLLAILFVVLAIGEGIGHPSVPAGDVALIEDAPDGNGHVSKAEFKHALVQSAHQLGLKTTPKPGDQKYKEAKEAALKGIFESIWLEGLAAERGVTVSDKEVAEELKTLKKENFKTEAEYEKFLKEAHYTTADINRNVKLRALSTKLEEELKEEAPTPSHGEIADYYEAAKSTQFTEEAKRNIRVILNKDRKKAEQAKAILAKDHSDKSWKRVAKKYSEDPATKGKGGLHADLTESAAEESLGPAAFTAPKGKLEGPLKTKDGYYVFEVESSTPERVTSLEDAEEEVKGQLEQQGQEKFFFAFVRHFTGKWRARTFCASGYLTESCANFKPSAHPASAPPACYEANPKKAPQECPAPVQQATPALPGSIDVLTPEGQKLAQRPVPAGGGSAPAAPSFTGAPPIVPSE